jgi:heat shock protein HtpX
MSESSAPVLVYDRIDSNRDTTRRLLIIFAFALLPVATGATVWMMPAIAGPLMMIGGASPALQSAAQEMSTNELAAIEVGVLLLAFAAAMVGMAVATVFFLTRYATAMVLRAARARPCDRASELELHRVVENLCIGAGIPMPRLYVIESTTPNAFAAGRDAADASIAVSRGLLLLLDRRELEGVIAHELSHVGNQDIRLNTTLSALIGTMTIPLNFVTGIFRRHRIIAVFGGFALLQLVAAFLFMAQLLLSGELGLPSLVVWWSLHALITPFYIVLGAPVIGKLVQRAVSREREYLADADAVLLTRNPEALAKALVKVDAVSGSPLRVGPATEHFYFVDPLGAGAPWLARWFRTHPPVSERLELLARMGSGIPASVLDEAADAAAESRVLESAPADGPDEESSFFDDSVTAFSEEPERGLQSDSTPSTPKREIIPLGIGVRPMPDGECDGPGDVVSGEALLGARFRLREHEAPLYEKPDGWSRVVERLEQGAVLTARDRENGFLRVSTGDGVVGYLGKDQRLAVAGEEDGV